MKKNKGYTKQYKNDDPTTHLTDVEQQKNMLLDTIDDAMERKKIKKIKKYEEPEIDQSINRIAESRLKYEARKTKTKPPEFFEKNNSNVNSGLAGILAVSKRIKD